MGGKGTKTGRFQRSAETTEHILDSKASEFDRLPGQSKHRQLNKRIEIELWRRRSRAQNLDGTRTGHW